MAAETLPPAETYYNALDYDGTTVYSYGMASTYWFNDYGELFSGGYSMEQDEYLTVLKDLDARITKEYGEATVFGYYDYSNSAVSFSSDDEMLTSLRARSVYYYSSFTDGGSGLIVDLCAESTETGGYAFYIYYTDLAYWTDTE